MTIKLADISINNNSPTVTVNSSENLSSLIKGDSLQVAGQLVEQIYSVDQVGRTLTLVGNWEHGNVVNVAARVIHTAADFRKGVSAISDLTSIASQSINQWDALANTVTTVTITLPDGDTVDVPSIPKAIQDASGLQSNAQAAIDLMGDAPALAQQVADDKDTVFSYLTTAEDVAIDTDVYSLLHYAAKATSAKTSAETAQGLAEDARTGAQTAQGLSEDARDGSVTAQGLAEGAKTDAETAQGFAESAKTDAETAQGIAETARDKAADWADKATEVETGRFSAKYWADQAEAITDTASYVLQTRTINGYDLSANRVLNAADVNALPDTYVPTIANVTGLQTELTTLQTNIDTVDTDLTASINRARRLALAGI